MTTTPRPKLSKRKAYTLAALLVILFGTTTYTARIKPALKPNNSPREASSTPQTTPQTPTKIQDITQALSTSTEKSTKTTQPPFPQRTISTTVKILPQPARVAAKPLKEEKMASPRPNLAQTAELLQATLTLAKSQAARQTDLAKLHTLIALLQNPTQTPEQQQKWAQLTLQTSQKLNIQPLSAALNTFLTPKEPQQDAPKAEKLPTFLAPFQNLIHIKRANTPVSAQHFPLQPILNAYQQFLTQESL